MFDIGWTELMLIGVVALIVIGPKDLPEMFRTLGRFTAKLRSMSRDFSRAMEQAAKDSGVNDVAKDIRNVASPSSLGLNAVKDAAAKFEKWDPLKAAKPVQNPAAKPLNVTLPAGNQAVATPVVPEPEVVVTVAPAPAIAAKLRVKKVVAAPAPAPAQVETPEQTPAPAAKPRKARTKADT